MSFSASVSHNDDILFTFCPTEVDWLEKVVIFHYLITTVDCLPERGPTCDIRPAAAALREQRKGCVDKESCSHDIHYNLHNDF